MVALIGTRLWELVHEAAVDIDSSLPIALDYRRMVWARLERKGPRDREPVLAELSLQQTLIRVVCRNADVAQAAAQISLFSLLSERLFDSTAVVARRQRRHLVGRGRSFAREVRALSLLVEVSAQIPSQVPKMVFGRDNPLYLQYHAAGSLAALGSYLEVNGYALTPPVRRGLQDSTNLRRATVVTEFEGLDPIPRPLPRSWRHALEHDLESLAPTYA